MYNPFSLSSKVILVTGASSGIGKSVAVECSKLGATLIITGRNVDRLKETYDLLANKGHLSVPADLTQAVQRSELISQIDKVDGIVHCAGISGHYLFPYLKEDLVEKMFHTNFFSALYLTKDLFKLKKINKGSSIVFISSTSGILSSYIGGSLYSATKGALNGLIKGIALEFAVKNIRVNSIMPGMIETPIMDGGDITEDQFEEDKKKYPLKRYGKPEEVAWGVAYLLSNASRWITGSNILMDGGRSIVY